jgi:hypothetical protein
MTKLLHKKYGLFTVIVGLYYIIQFVACVAACNFYSDATRKSACIDEYGEVKFANGDDASSVMDTAILLTGIFHVMEWIRSTILLTVVLIGVNLMWFWYISGLFSSIFGFVSFIYLIAIFFGDASSCKVGQATRY